MRPLKVCHILFGLDIGGIETLAVKLVNRMDRSRFEQSIVCLTEQDELASEIEPGAARRFHLRRKEGHDLALLPRVARLLGEIRPDVIHTRNWSTFLEGILPSLLVGIQGRVHSFDGLNADNLGPEPRRRIIAQRLLMPFVDQVVARSEAMRDAMCEQLRLSPDRVRLIADGIDLERFDRPVDKDAVRARFGLSADDVVVGIVARLDPVKDHRTLFRALALAHSREPALKLLIVGGGPLEDELRREAAGSPLRESIVFTGPQLDVPSLYGVMDIYAQPSLYEGVSGSILEAMAARLPVISTRVGGTVDIVREGQNGFLVEPGDEGALAAHVLKLVGDRALARTLGDSGRRLVEERFSLARVLDQYAEVYESAARGRWAA